MRLGNKTVSITMRTPGNDFELAAGFLFAEGIIDDASQVLDIAHKRAGSNPRQARNAVTVRLKPDVEIDFDRLERHFYTASSCGVCGKASIAALEVKGCPVLPANTPVVDAATIHRLPAVLRKQQAGFERTGGLHAAALFDASGKLISLREDVGRHNALDKLIGAEFLAGRTPLSDLLVLVSCRASFELIQKALRAGVPILATVGAPSSLAVELALRFQMTLAGFVRNDRFNIYSGRARISEAARENAS